VSPRPQLVSIVLFTIVTTLVVLLTYYFSTNFTYRGSFCTVAFTDYDDSEHKRIKLPTSHKRLRLHWYEFRLR